MKKQICLGLVLFAIFTFMGISTYQALGINNHGDGVGRSASTSSPASAPWFIETVYSQFDVGQHVSIALDHISGKPYISFYDANYYYLRMAKYFGPGGNCGANNDWMCEAVDDVGNVGQYSSIALDPIDGFPMIAYFATTNGGALKLAVRTLFDWNIQTIDDPLLVTAGQYASVAINSNAEPRIAYYHSNPLGVDSLWYAEYVGGVLGTCSNYGYDCEPVDSGENVGKYASLALDSADSPIIAYYDGENDALRYAYYDDGWRLRWIMPSGESGGQFASLAIDVNNSDRLHVAHYDSVNGTLEYAKFVGADGNCGTGPSTILEWQCDEIDSMGLVTNPRGISLALDGAGYPIIAYQTGGSGLKIARPAAALGQLSGNCGPEDPFYTWQCDVISMGYGIGQGDYMSLAVNSSGLSTIAYYGNSTEFDGDLVIAFQRLQVFLPLTLKQW